jgi:uncharacterized membrane protein
VTRKPATEDYVPLLPWFGLVLIGLWLGRWAVGAWPGAWNAALAGAAGRSLAWAGRHSLAVYMLHQPILFTGFYLLT